MAKVRLKLKGFDDIVQTINTMGLNVHTAMEQALMESYTFVTEQVKQELIRYKVNSGEMKNSLLDNQQVRWIGETCYIDAGFNQDESMHATYMMITGTPYRKPDKQLYNAIYGTKTKKEIKKIQEQAIMRVLEGGQK